MLTILGISMSLRAEQPLNADSSMLVTEGIVMPAREVHLSNVLLPMLVTFAGISMLVRDVQR